MNFALAFRLFTLLICLVCTSLAIPNLPAVCQLPATQSIARHDSYFAVFPYIQPGYHFKGNNLTVSWLCHVSEAGEPVFQYKLNGATDWTGAPLSKQSVNGHPELNLLFAEMQNLKPDAQAEYRICKEGKELFQASVPCPPAPGKPVFFAVAGDIGLGGEAQAKIAAVLHKRKPPMGIIVGDIVYPVGTVKNYLINFFPYLNGEDNKVQGQPVLRSMMTAAIVGNHDLTYGGGVDARDLYSNPDSMAYFTLWKEPLNGPQLSDKLRPRPLGNLDEIKDFFKAAGESYPRMGNFSYDYGNCHIVALDANGYMDWRNKDLRDWLENDLKETKLPWKIVAFHQPPFSSDPAHQEEQHMRHLCDIFERQKVDIVFAGHTHTYQRSKPLHFKETAASLESLTGRVDGTFKIDQSYDGVKNCKPDGVLYIVTGAAGARLSSASLSDEPGKWFPFTRVFLSRQHSVTLCRADSHRFSVEQVGEDDRVIDQFAIEK